MCVEITQCLERFTARTLDLAVALTITRQLLDTFLPV